MERESQVAARLPSAAPLHTAALLPVLAGSLIVTVHVPVPHRVALFAALTVLNSSGNASRSTSHTRLPSCSRPTTCSQLRSYVRVGSCPGSLARSRDGPSRGISADPIARPGPAGPTAAAVGRRGALREFQEGPCPADGIP